MILPFALIALLLTRFLLEGMMTRQEVAVYTRGSTASAAVADRPGPAHCRFDDAAFAARDGVTQDATVTCTLRDGETGLRSEPRFWEAMDDGARAFRRHGDLIRDVTPDRPAQDIVGRGEGSMSFTRPDFLSMQGASATRGAHLRPEHTVWDHRADPLRAGYDPVLWEALRQQGTWRLFPEVFPGAGP